ncbi:MAG: transcription antitermination protein NusB, partial [Akkermansiaceae bacterium]|nr:transcription antitermination protein NusB [Akkermansiaceae bacterium]
MGKRRDGREAAIQFLFNRDINKELGPDDFDAFFSICIAQAGAKKFAKELLSGMLDNLEEIDKKLEPELENFELPRLSTIDRNVLRLATYEMFYLDDAPP